MPNIETLLASIHNVEYITKLDMNCAYHQLELHPETRELTTFVLPSGLYRYRKCPFGLSDQPGSFQLMMDTITAGYPGVYCYLDDIIIVGKSSEEHDSRLHTLLKKLKSYGATLNREKCVYKVKQLDWLGYEISSNGIQMTDKNISAIKNLPTPKNVSQLRTVLGTLQYYSKFIPHFSERVELLRALTR